MSAFEVMMATEAMRDSYVTAIVKAANLRPGPFELTASEKYIIVKANEQLAVAQQLYREEQTMKDKIEMPEGTTGQQPQWPGETPVTKESGTDSVERTDSTPEGTRKPERIHIPVVR